MVLFSIFVNIFAAKRAELSTIDPVVEQFYCNIPLYHYQTGRGLFCLSNYIRAKYFI